MLFLGREILVANKKGYSGTSGQPFFLSLLLKWQTRRLFLLMSVLAQTFFTLVRSHLVALVLLTVWHI